MVDEIDAIAHRYGILPHQVLELDPFQLALAGYCVSRVRDRQADVMRKAAKSLLGVVPAMTIEV